MERKVKINPIECSLYMQKIKKNNEQQRHFLLKLEIRTKLRRLSIINGSPLIVFVEFRDQRFKFVSGRRI